MSFIIVKDDFAKEDVINTAHISGVTQVDYSFDNETYSYKIGILQYTGQHRFYFKEEENAIKSRLRVIELLGAVE